MLRHHDCPDSLLASCHDNGTLPSVFKQLERLVVDAYVRACLQRPSAHALDRYSGMG